MKVFTYDVAFVTLYSMKNIIICWCFVCCTTQVALYGQQNNTRTKTIALTAKIDSLSAIVDSLRAAQVLKPPLWVWGTAALGVTPAFSPFFQEFGGGMVFDNVAIALEYNSGIQLEASRYGSTGIGGFAVMGGWAFHRKKNTLIYVAAGVSSLSYQSYNITLPSNQTAQAIGFACQAQAVFAWSYIGLGVALSSNLNQYHSWVGVKVSAHIGLLPDQTQ
jgi:hypothetical protein